MIQHPVMEPKLYELKIASSVYEPQYNVDWCDKVEAWITTFVDQYNKEDTLDYMFNSKDKLEEILIELMGEITESQKELDSQL